MLNLIKGCHYFEAKNVNSPQAAESNAEEIGSASSREAVQNPILNPLNIFAGNNTNMWPMVSGILPGKTNLSYCITLQIHAH